MAKAYYSRLYADNLVKFNFYIANMPNENLSSIEELQRNRIKKLSGQSNCDENSIEILIDQVQI